MARTKPDVLTNRSIQSKRDTKARKLGDPGVPLWYHLGDPLGDKFAGPMAQWRVKTWLSMGTESALLEHAPCSMSFSERTPLLFDSKTLS